ncbi:hypothetical protein ACTXT7_004722 [Hymenolepis weldensis]
MIKRRGSKIVGEQHQGIKTQVVNRRAIGDVINVVHGKAKKLLINHEEAVERNHLKEKALEGAAKQESESWKLRKKAIEDETLCDAESIGGFHGIKNLRASAKSFFKSVKSHPVYSYFIIYADFL